VNEVIVIFSADSVCKHSCVLFFSARISLTPFLRRRQRWGNYQVMALAQRDQSLKRFLACFKKPTGRFVMPIAPSWIVSW